jgi:hypothetical protein
MRERSETNLENPRQAGGSLTIPPGLQGDTGGRTEIAPPGMPAY